MLGHLACCSKHLSSPCLGRKQAAPYYENHSRESPKVPSSGIERGDVLSKSMSWRIHVAANNSISCQFLGENLGATKFF